MGTCNLQENHKSSINRTTKDFRFRTIVGKGGFGSVWKVQKKDDHKIYAMKILSKAQILYRHSVYSVMNERRLLAHLNHP